MNLKSQDSKNGLLNWKSHLAHFFHLFFLLYHLSPLIFLYFDHSLIHGIVFNFFDDTTMDFASKGGSSPYERVFSCTGMKQDHNNPRNCVPLFLISLIRLEFYPVFFPTLIRTWSREVPAGEKHL